LYACYYGHFGIVKLLIDNAKEYSAISFPVAEKIDEKTETFS